MGQSKKSTRASTDGLDSKISSALVRLARSFDHASDTDRDRWDFAINRKQEDDGYSCGDPQREDGT